MKTSAGHSTTTPPVTFNMKDRSVLLLCLGLALLGACHRATPPAASAEVAAAEAPQGPAEGEAQSGVTLKPEEIANMGIITSAADATTFAAEVAGYAVVLAHDVIAQAVADVATADAAARQSRAALARVKNLAGTPGAFSAETQETTERQAAADEAALILAQRKLSATFGQSQPWQNKEGGLLLNDVASGRTKLVRATFPLGALTGAAPRSLQVARPDPTGKAERWKTGAVWAAPADAAIPGRSLFTLLKNGDVGEGERLDVWAATDAHESGVLIPQAAVVISEDKYWCYVEKQPGTFERVAIDASRPVDGGYFVKGGVAAADRIVTAAAGLLLARETNPSTEAE